MFLSRRRVAWLLIAYWAVLIVGTHWPAEMLADDWWQTRDKLLHFAGYALLGGLLALWRTAGKSHPAQSLRLRLLHAWLLAAGFAVLDEITQPLTGRNCNLGDWLADALGAAAGCLAAGLWRTRLARRFQRTQAEGDGPRTLRAAATPSPNAAATPMMAASPVAKAGSSTPTTE